MAVKHLISEIGFNDGVAHPLASDIATIASMLAYVESATTGAGQAVQCASMVHATRVVTLLHNWPLTPTGTVVIKLYNSLTRSPAHVVASNDVDFTATQKTYVPTTAAKTVLDLFAAILDQATGQLDEGSVAEPLKANVKEINDVTIDGAGTSGDPWGPA